MAIAPPTDLVLDVARAADPQALRAAADKLQRLAYAAGPGSESFSETLGQASSDAVPVHLRSSAASARVAMHNETTLAGRAASPVQKFEALVLQQFVESMLPDDAESVFGSGTAGGIWKSMLAEQIGTQIAARGGIGIAEILSTTLKTRT
ncbi:rod-binding protein [Polymorphum gilvum]|uniref:Hypothetical conserved protein n=1 Tax=Polymorphum gilvum (strain LMG 25793 / CGMCC 1.9160 / SL003B-26A1) TaxID=991905 RepID=F2J4N0_POLGS|nr:rod-binding protein [Polymorphum gilvum]ADZ72282.1 Hypothetical conserved protein [Polymorphum gilvum SL003B-26A1]